MKKILQVARILLIMGLMTVGLASIASAQVTSYVDDHGTVVFINADPPRSVARSTPAKPAKAGDLTAGGAAPTAPPIVAKEATPATPPASNDAAVAKPEAAANAASGPAAPPDSTANAAVPAAAPTEGATGDASTAFDRVIEESAGRNHVDPALVRALISTESNWNSSAVSSKGAQGLMQLIPQTAQSLGVANAFDPRQNIDGGVRYLSMLLSRYNGDLNKALAAYNAGPGAVDRFGGVPNYRETRDYVQKVTSTYMRPESARQPRAHDAPVPIYRTTDESGRVIFVNE